MNRFLRTIWSINGVLLLLLFVFFGVILMIEFFNQFPSSEPSRVIVGEELEKAKKEGLILQGLSYDDPIKVLGSSGYILPIEVATYNKPKRQSTPLGRAFDSRHKLRVDVDYLNTMNVVFLNRDLQVTNILLDRKGFIRSFRYPSGEQQYQVSEQIDTTIRNIVYLISFEDSNKDGRMDNEDFADLYLTSLAGDNFDQVTRDIDILDFKFMTPNTMLISYHKRDDKNEQEHKRKYFGRYDIQAKKFEELTDLHQTLDKLEDILIR